MGQPAPQTKDIERAQAGVISDRLLAHLIACADEAEAGELSPAGAELMLLCYKPLLLELSAYRERTALACEIMPDALMANALPPHCLTANVIFLRGDA